MVTERKHRALVVLALLVVAAGAAVYYFLAVREGGAGEAEVAAAPEHDAAPAASSAEDDPEEEPPRIDVDVPPGAPARPRASIVDDGGGVRAASAAPPAPVVLPSRPMPEPTPERRLRLAEGVQRAIDERLAQLTAEAEEARAAGREAQARRLERAIERLRRHEPVIDQQVEAARRAAEASAP